MSLFLIFAFLFGLLIGSFLNVVVLRFRTGRGLGGRSSCGSCRHVLRWFELIPLFSFLFQRGRCRACCAHISWQYPIVEILTGILFTLALSKAFSAGILIPLHALHLAFIMSILVVITVYDIRHTIIPDSLVYTFAALALSYGFMPYAIIPYAPWWYPFVSGLIAAFPFAFLWFVSGGRWMGFGDAKLSLGIGFMLGILGSISALIWAFWSGALVSLALIILSKTRLRWGSSGLTMKSEVPFAPFLILGLLIVLFGSIDILTLIGYIS
ncbi:MAG: prepilin peptidase [Patescibacteria group bacterium]